MNMQDLSKSGNRYIPKRRRKNLEIPSLRKQLRLPISNRTDQYQMLPIGDYVNVKIMNTDRKVKQWINS